jgi:hypothetical protein
MLCRASLVAAGLLAASALAACSAVPKRESAGEHREQFLQYAGPPIESFTYLRRYSAWRPLGDRQLVLWTDRDDAYLLTVLPPCVGLDVADGIGVSSSSHTITRGVDAVTFDHQDCFISQIRHVNYEQMRRATRG